MFQVKVGLPGVGRFVFKTDRMQAPKGFENVRLYTVLNQETLPLLLTEAYKGITAVARPLADLDGVVSDDAAVDCERVASAMTAEGGRFWYLKDQDVPYIAVAKAYWDEMQGKPPHYLFELATKYSSVVDRYMETELSTFTTMTGLRPSVVGCLIGLVMDPWNLIPSNRDWLEVDQAATTSRVDRTQRDVAEWVCYGGRPPQQLSEGDVLWILSNLAWRFTYAGLAPLDSIWWNHYRNEASTIKGSGAELAAIYITTLRVFRFIIGTWMSIREGRSLLSSRDIFLGDHESASAYDMMIIKSWSEQYAG